MFPKEQKMDGNFLRSENVKSKIDSSIHSYSEEWMFVQKKKLHIKAWKHGFHILLKREFKRSLVCLFKESGFSSLTQKHRRKKEKRQIFKLSISQCYISESSYCWNSCVLLPHPINPSSERMVPKAIFLWVFSREILHCF